MDKIDVVNMIVEKQEISAKEAEKKLDSIVKAIKAKDKYADFTDEEIYNVAASALGAKYNKPEIDFGEEFVGVVVGIGNTFDANAKVLRDAIAMVKADPESEFVQYDKKGDPIYLDFRTVVGGGKFENWNFKKPITRQDIRYLYMIVDEKLVEVMQGKITPISIGGEYSFMTKGKIESGKVNGSNFTYKGSYQPEEMWSVMFGFDEYYDKVFSVPKVHKCTPRDIVLTGGFVERAFPTKNGGFGIVISDDETLTVFVNGEENVGIAMNVDTGMEILVFGQVTANNRDGGNNVTAYGIFVNPRSNDYNTLAHEFDSVL